MFKTDVLALGDHLDNLMECYDAAGIRDEFPQVLDRLSGAIDSREWANRVVYQRALWAWDHSTDDDACRAILSNIEQISTVRDPHILALHLHMNKSLGFEQCLRIAATIIEESPEPAWHLQYRVLIGIYKFEIGEREDGLSAVRAAIEQYEIAPSPKRSLYGRLQHGHALQFLGTETQDTKLLQEAEAEFKVLLDHDSLSPGLRADLLRDLGRTAIARADYAGARRFLGDSDAVRKNALNSIHLAEALLHAGDNLEARRELDGLDWDTLTEDAKFAFCSIYGHLALQMNDADMMRATSQRLRDLTIRTPRLREVRDQLRITLLETTYEQSTAEMEVQRAKAVTLLDNVSSFIRAGSLHKSSSAPPTHESTSQGDGPTALSSQALGDLPRAKELLPPAIASAPKKLGDDHTTVATFSTQERSTMTEMHDVFICHASEDKARFVDPLVEALVGRGLRVWYDRFEIGLGDDFRAKMNEGLRGSRFGVVLVSPSSFEFWPQAELSALFNQEARTRGELPRILPVRCDLSLDELTERDPLLSGRRSIGWDDGLDAIVRAIVAVVARSRGPSSTTAATATPDAPAPPASVAEPPAPSPAASMRTIQAQSGVDLGIVIALPEELRQVLALVEGYARHPTADLDAYVFTRNGYRCAAVLVGEMGQTQTGVFTERFIRALVPWAIVSMGVAGGLNDLRAGDIHVPTQSVEYLQDSKAQGVAGGGFAIVPGAPAYRVDYALLRAARALEFDHPAAFRAWLEQAALDFAALLPDPDKRRALIADRDVRESVLVLADGHVATGPAVGAARAFADWIRSHDRNVKSLEMESAAVVLAAQTRTDPRRALIIRAISDLGDERKKELDAKSDGVLRRYAMRNAIRYLWTLLDVGAFPLSHPPGRADA